MSFINIDFMAGFFSCWFVLYVARHFRKKKLKEKIMWAICCGPLNQLKSRLNQVLDENL